MNVLETIKSRRSIRSFKDKAVSGNIMQNILLMGTKAPSGKNRQPWHFKILEGSAKNRLTDLMDEKALTKQSGSADIGSLQISSNAIKEASAVILVYNRFSKHEQNYDHYKYLMDTQSIGAAVQNIILAAKAFNLGSLWICDIFQCDKEISEWLSEPNELMAAVAIGYPNQKPYERPRIALNELTEWIK
ncbi:nitroreductase family protein [Pectinatus frisingensis]|jgi:nitroreductase|uniref:nitroreductase family protein n=1 Tax=Pectinatus frisingensis TaxID=865 RepID=UPI0018C48EEB|nr:nitroreductase family protein [Pectinatus frisingensis]